MAGNTYLIDFENVHENGLAGIEHLDMEDCVYLFFTDHASKVTLNCLTDIAVPVIAKKALIGKQSLDMSLVSFLGYLIGVESDQNHRYVIISKDTDFDTVCTFWNYHCGTNEKVLRAPSIGWLYKSMGTDMDDLKDVPFVSAITLDELERQILRIIRLFGERNRDNSRSILLSKLCEELKDQPAYQEIKQFSKLKPYQILERYFAHIVSLKTTESSIYVFDFPNISIKTQQQMAELQKGTPTREVDEISDQGQSEFTPAEAQVGLADEFTDMVEIKTIFEVEAVPQIPEMYTDEEPDCNADEPLRNTNEGQKCQTSDVQPEAVQNTDTTAEDQLLIIRDALQGADMGEQVLNEVDEMVAMLIDERTGKRSIYQAIITRFGRQEGLRIYSLVKTALERKPEISPNCFLKQCDKRKKQKG